MLTNVKPFFSVIIAVYNQEKYISRAINSVINQVFQDFELIIVNDCSTDDTGLFIEDFAKQNKKIFIINHNKNESQLVANIDGVAAANGEYIIFLDADDYFTGDAFTLLYDSIKKNPEYDFYEFGYITQPAKEKVFPSFFGSDRFSAFFNKENYPAHTFWNKVYNSLFLKKVFSYIERVYIKRAQDIYESIVIAYFSQRTMIINEIITNYSVGTGISTSDFDYSKYTEVVESAKRTIDLVKNFLNKIGCEKDCNVLFLRRMNNSMYNYINGIIKKKTISREEINAVYNTYWKNYRNMYSLNKWMYMVIPIFYTSITLGRLYLFLGKMLNITLRVCKNLCIGKMR